MMITLLGAGYHGILRTSDSLAGRVQPKPFPSDNVLTTLSYYAV